MFKDLNIPTRLRRIIDRELQAGEVIRWVEQPPISRFLTTETILLSISAFCLAFIMVPFAIVTIRSFFWGAGEPIRTSNDVTQLWIAAYMLPFGLFSSIGIVQPILLCRSARNTLYLVTDRRAISLHGKYCWYEGWSITIRSHRPEQLTKVHTKTDQNGTGDVILEIQRWEDNDGKPLIEDIIFLGVQNPTNVETMIRQCIPSKV